LTFSEQLDQWSGSNVTITSNTSQSPDGSQNADNVNITATSGFWRKINLTLVNSTSYTASVFVKKSATTGTKTFRFYYNNVAAAPNDGEWVCVVDLTNITATTFAGGTVGTGRPTILSTKIIGYGNEWYRVEVAFTVGSGAGNSSSTLGFLANGEVIDFNAWGAQLESGTYATTYIPTSTAAVTRLADTCSLTGASSIIGQTEGTLFVDVDNNESETAAFVSLSNASASVNNHIWIGQVGTNIALFVRSGGTYSILASSITSALGVKKIALAYGASFARLYVNGTQVFDSTAAVIPSGMDKIEVNNLNTSIDVGRVSLAQSALYTTRLSNSELQALTTL
jgi:hypothetical protein